MSFDEENVSNKNTTKFNEDIKFNINSDESSKLLRRNSADILRKRVKSVDKLNVHEEAVKTCLFCPDFCFQTLFGIHFHPLNFILLSIWLLGILIFIIMVGGALESKWHRVNADTATSVSLHHTQHLDFPAITICNMAHEVPLTPVKCSSFDSTKACPDYRIPIHLKDLVTTKKILDSSKAAGAIKLPNNIDNRNIDDLKKINLTDVKEQQLAMTSQRNTLRHCLVFNNNKAEQYSTQRKGLADALTVVLSINIDMYPKHAKYSGVHIDLHSQCDRQLGECPKELDSTLVAAPGSPRFYRMTKHHHHYLNGTVTEYFEAKDSASGDYDFERHFGAVNDTGIITVLAIQSLFYYFYYFYYYYLIIIVIII
jgi:hypothetical protein